MRLPIQVLAEETRSFFSSALTEFFSTHSFRLYNLGKARI